MRQLAILAIVALAGCSLIAGTEAHREKLAREALSREGGLRDPVSAILRNVHEGKETPDDSLFCGEVNAKNALGAYTGFRRFIVGQKDFTAFEPDGDDPHPHAMRDFDQVWAACQAE